MSENFNVKIQREIEQNYRFNFLVNALDGASFWFGMSFISVTVILPLYVSNFTNNPLLIGLIPFIYAAGDYLPQLFMANVVERAPRKKVFPVNLGFFAVRLPIILLAPAAYLLAVRQPALALISFFVLWSWYSIGLGTTLVGWQDMIAKIFPLDKRGRFLGITNFIGTGTGILGAMAVPFVLQRSGFPYGYVFAFTAAAVMMFLSWFSLSLAREPAVPSSRPPVSQTAYLRSLPDVVRRDRNLRMYLLTMTIFSLSGMATGFLVVYAVRNWNLPDAQASGFTIAMQVGLALANLFFGFLADHKGHKLSLEICFLFNILSLALAIFAPNPAWFFPVFFLRGVVNAAVFISSISIVYEFTGADNRSTYIGLANTIPGIAGAVAPLIGGWLAGAANYQTMFIISAVLGVLSLAMLRFAVLEPRKIASAALSPEELPFQDTGSSS